VSVVNFWFPGMRDRLSPSRKVSPGNRELKMGVPMRFPGNREWTVGAPMRFPGNRELKMGATVRFPGNRELKMGATARFPGNRDVLVLARAQPGRCYVALPNSAWRALSEIATTAGCLSRRSAEIA
jgi:hypothetical protein